MNTKKALSVDKAFFSMSNRELIIVLESTVIFDLISNRKSEID